MWCLLSGRRPLEDCYSAPRRVRRRIIFNDTTKATLEGFAAMWEIPAKSESDLSEIGSLFADDAYLRKEYVELFALIFKEFENQGGTGTALIRGSSGIGKSAFLQYCVARIRNHVSDVLVVRGSSFDSREKVFLHLSTSWFGWKTTTTLSTFNEAIEVEKKCAWTLVDGCDWEPIANNCTVGAASPSTPWKGFRLVEHLVQICMPPWSLSQLEDCAASTTGVSNLPTVRENYKLVGGIARWALFKTSPDVLDHVSSAVRGVNFDILQQVMATQHATKNDEKELVHRLVLWKTSLDQFENWMYRITAENNIHYSLLTRFVSKELAKKAATLSIQKRKMLMSELKGESAASAYRGVIFEADAIDRLVCGGTFTLRKCTTGEQQQVQLTLPNTRARYAMANLDSLDVGTAVGRIVVPNARNFESVDAFRVSSASILQQGRSLSPKAHYETMQFQMTVRESHPTKLKGVKDVMEMLRNNLQNGDVTCAVVFVVPDDVQTFYEKPQSVLKNDGSVRVRRDCDFSDDNQYCLVIDYSL